MFDEQFAAGEQILRCLVENEAERPHVGAVTASFAGVKKLHVPVLEQSELQSLRHVIHFCRHHGERQFYVFLKLLIDIQQ